MPGPAPTYQPTFSDAAIAECQRLVRQHTAPQAQVYRAKLALLLHEQPALDIQRTACRTGPRHDHRSRFTEYAGPRQEQLRGSLSGTR